MPNCWWHDRGTYPREGASISLGPSHAPHPRRHLRAVCVARVRGLRGSAAPLDSAECTTAAPLSGVEWCAHAQRSSGAVEVDGTRRQHDGQGHLAYPREGASILPTAPPQPMILGRTGGHICYDGVAKRAIGSGVEHFLHTEGVAGSNPASPTRQIHEVSDSLTSFLRCE